jgi:hypothetical protein
MVFPSLMFNVEPGVISQVSAFAVIGFSFLLHKMKRIILVTFFVLAGVFIYNSSAHSFAAFPGQQYNNYGPYQTYTTNNLNYYGRPWGNVPPAYFYPQMQYHSLWGPQQPYYFNPHPQSPYAPNYNCPFCGPYQQQQPQPQFPTPMIHPGGGVS